MLYGVIDIGANTIRLVVYNVKGKKIYPVLNNKYSAGLAAYITAKNKMSSEGINVTVEILKEIRSVTDRIGLDEVLPFGTSPFRGISNSQEYVQRIKNETGFDVEIFSGEEEARYDYYGAVNRISFNSGILTDVGGGSTEIVFFKDKRIVKMTSIPVGSLNLYKRFVDGILPSSTEINKMKHEVAKQIVASKIRVKDVPVERMCAVGGSARTALKLYKSQKENRSMTHIGPNIMMNICRRYQMDPRNCQRSF